MEIWHRISFNASAKPDLFSLIGRSGYKYQSLKLPGKGGNLVFFDIEESDLLWKEVDAFVRRTGVSDVAQTIFQEEEILSAEWVRLVPVFEQGYPEPENSWMEKRPNYKDFCPQCGTHDQIGNFHLKTEPLMGKNQFFSLIGTHAVFCTRVALDEFVSHEFRGYEAWSAIIHSLGMPSKLVQQLHIPNTAGPGLLDDRLRYDKCSNCGLKKYVPHMRGIMFLKRDALDPAVDFARTYEWFGSGGQAYREVLISNRVARLIIQRKWQGVLLKVVDLI